MSVNLEASREDSALITRIIRRFNSENPIDLTTNRLALMMDLTACHLNGCPLNLPALFTAAPQDFDHDLRGITMNINRETGKLENCFLPRFALACIPE